MNILLSLLMTIPLSYISMRWGNVKVHNLLTVEQILLTVFYCNVFQPVFKHGLKNTLKEVKEALLAFFTGKYWCEEKGYWIRCSKKCETCKIHTKMKITLTEARIFYMLYVTTVIVLIFFAGHVILNPGLVWG